MLNTTITTYIYSGDCHFTAPASLCLLTSVYFQLSYKFRFEDWESTGSQSSLKSIFKYQISQNHHFNKGLEQKIGYQICNNLVEVHHSIFNLIVNDYNLFDRSLQISDIFVSPLHFPSIQSQWLCWFVILSSLFAPDGCVPAINLYC